MPRNTSRGCLRRSGCRIEERKVEPAEEVRFYSNESEERCREAERNTRQQEEQLRDAPLPQGRYHEQGEAADGGDDQGHRHLSGDCVPRGYENLRGGAPRVVSQGLPGGKIFEFPRQHRR